MSTVSVHAKRESFVCGGDPPFSLSSSSHLFSPMLCEQKNESLQEELKALTEEIEKARAAKKGKFSTKQEPVENNEFEKKNNIISRS